LLKSRLCTLLLPRFLGFLDFLILICGIIKKNRIMKTKEKIKFTLLGAGIGAGITFIISKVKYNKKLSDKGEEILEKKDKEIAQVLKEMRNEKNKTEKYEQ